MTWLTALLPVKDGVGVYAALTRTADTARAAATAEPWSGDGRHLVGSVVGAAARRDEDAARWEQPASDESGTPARRGSW